MFEVDLKDYSSFNDLKIQSLPKVYRNHTNQKVYVLSYTYLDKEIGYIAEELYFVKNQVNY